MMHVLFSEEELEWVNKKTFGWPIKDGCPDTIRKAIRKKKQLIANQMNEVRNAEKRKAEQILQ